MLCDTQDQKASSFNVKKTDFTPKSSDFRISSPHTGSSSQKKQPKSSNTVTSGKVPVPNPTVHNFKDTKIHGKTRRSRVKLGGGVDVNDEEWPSKEETSASTGKASDVTNTAKKTIANSTEDGPFRKQTPTASKGKLGPKMKQNSKKTPQRRYYRPSEDTKMFYINNKGHLQCHQDLNLIHQPNDKGKLPGSREAPIYHEPGTVSCRTVEDIKKLYPNSFDRLGSLKGAYNIRVDPKVKPATHARRKVPIESEEAIDKELDYLIEEEIIMEQVEPTPWVSSVTFP